MVMDKTLVRRIMVRCPLIEYPHNLGLKARLKGTITAENTVHKPVVYLKNTPLQSKTNPTYFPDTRFWLIKRAWEPLR